MTALAQKLPALSVPASVREHLRAAPLVAAMLLLFLLAGVNLALNGSGPGFNSPQLRAAVPRSEAARLQIGRAHV